MPTVTSSAIPSVSIWSVCSVPFSVFAFGGETSGGAVRSWFLFFPISPLFCCFFIELEKQQFKCVILKNSKFLDFRFLFLFSLFSSSLFFGRCCKKTKKQ